MDIKEYPDKWIDHFGDTAIITRGYGSELLFIKTYANITQSSRNRLNHLYMKLYPKLGVYRLPIRLALNETKNYL